MIKHLNIIKYLLNQNAIINNIKLKFIINQGITNLR
jgi:hypothetical protein